MRTRKVISNDYGESNMQYYDAFSLNKNVKSISLDESIESIQKCIKIHQQNKTKFSISKLKL